MKVAKSHFLRDGLYIANSQGRGRGVFTLHDIAAATVIEIAPVIVLHKHERTLLHQTLLQNYYFCWPHHHGEACCMALGYISIYNHSMEANCIHTKQEDTQTMTIITRINICAGSELTINYNGAWDDQAPLWFEVE